MTLGRSPLQPERLLSFLGFCWLSGSAAVLSASASAVNTFSSALVIGRNTVISTNTKCANATLNLTSALAFSNLAITVGQSGSNRRYVIADANLKQCFNCSGFPAPGISAPGMNSAYTDPYLWTVFFPTANSFQLCAMRHPGYANTWGDVNLGAQYTITTTTCGAGQYINSATYLCAPCPTGKYTSIGSLSACSSCSAGQYVSSGASSCLNSCPVDQYNSSGVCTGCGSNCTSCSADGICLTCDPGYTLTYPNTCTLIRTTISAVTSTFNIGSNTAVVNSAAANLLVCQTVSISTAQDMALESVSLRTNSGTTTFSSSSGYCHGCSQASVPPVYGAGYPVSVAGDSYTWQLSYPSATSIKICVSRPGAGIPVGTWADNNLKLTYTVTYTKCNNGQYINSNFVCVSCPPGFFGSAVPLVSPQCSGPCASGTYSTLGSTSCSSQCLLGQYKSGGSCLSCSGSQVVSVDSTGCVASCPAGQYSNSGTCSYCVDNCAACTSDGCNQCKTSFATYGLSSPNVCTLAGSDQTTTGTPIVGANSDVFLPNFAFSMPLSATRALKSVSLTLSSGTPITFLASNGSCGAPSCALKIMRAILSGGYQTGTPDTFYWNLTFVSTTSFRVVVTRAGSNTWGDTTLKFYYTYVTTACSYGQYINQDYLCTSCPAGYYGNFVPLTTSQCSGPCTAGYYCNNTGSRNSTQYMCSSGDYCPAGSSTAQSCTAGSYCATPVSQIACYSGSYCPAGSTTQHACSVGKYCATPSSEVVCNAGSYCPANSTASTPCLLGSYCSTLSSQVACSSGSYCAAGSTVSVQCVAGSFCATPSSQVACSAGSYCPAGSTVQSACSAGSYCATSLTQVACSSGSYCPAGATAQVTCTVGHVCATATSRTACSSGSYCPAGSTAVSLCAAGYYCPTPANQIACDQSANCTAGSTVQTAPAVTSHTPTVTVGTVYLCPDGSWQSTMLCLTCPAGQYLNGASCQLCAPGTFTAAANSASTCSPCKAGSYASISGATSCTSCASGLYSSTLGATSASTCQSCAAGSATGSASGASSCTQCAAGSWAASSSSACTQCSAGSYSASLGATSSNTCLACASGSVSSSGSTACTQCPSGNVASCQSTGPAADSSSLPIGPIAGGVGAAVVIGVLITMWYYCRSCFVFTQCNSLGYLLCPQCCSLPVAMNPGGLNAKIVEMQVVKVA